MSTEVTYPSGAALTGDSKQGGDIIPSVRGWPKVTDSYNPNSPGSTFNRYNSNVDIHVAVGVGFIVKAPFLVTPTADGSPYYSSAVWLPPEKSILIQTVVAEISAVNYYKTGGSPTDFAFSVIYAKADNSAKELLLSRTLVGSDPGWTYPSPGNHLWAGPAASGSTFDKFIVGSGGSVPAGANNIVFVPGGPIVMKANTSSTVAGGGPLTAIKMQVTPVADAGTPTALITGNIHMVCFFLEDPLFG